MRLIEQAMPAGEKRGQAEHRRRLVAGLAGRMVELGAGINFQYYPGSVTEVVAIEPEGYLREVAQMAAQAAPVPVWWSTGSPGAGRWRTRPATPAWSASSSARSPTKNGALAELARVIRPGGELRL